MPARITWGNTLGTQTPRRVSPAFGRAPQAGSRSHGGWLTTQVGGGDTERQPLARSESVEYQDGEVVEEQRTCRDELCCAVLVAYVVGMVMIAVLTMANGDVNRILRATDYKGQSCG